MTLRDEMRLIAVYDSDPEAREAVRALEGSGVDTAQVRIDDRRDYVSAVEGEMRSETTNTIAGPGNVGPFPKEMAEGSLVGAVLGGIIGLAVMLPFAAIGFGDMVLWTRLFTVGIVGLIVGATMGWVIGGGFGAKRPDEPLAAERGTTVAVPMSEAAQAALITTNARRIDLVHPDGHPVNVVAERDAGPQRIVRDIGRHMQAEERQG
jgi:hypothetical protein